MQTEFSQPVQKEVTKPNDVITGEKSPRAKSPEVVDPDGFQRALKPIRVKGSQVKNTNVTNTYQVLNKQNDLEANGDTGEDEGVA